MNSPFVVKKSKIQGNGVFAYRDIKKGERLGFMKGKYESISKLDNSFRHGNTRNGVDVFQTSERRYIVLDRPYIYINHSCVPNIGIGSRRSIVALRPIRKGEEIFFDYSATEWTPQTYPANYGMYWPMPCRCGNRSCRGKVGCFPYLPKATQKRYLKSGVIQSFIRRKLRWPKEKQRCFVCEANL